MAQVFQDIYQDVLQGRRQILDSWRVICKEEPWVHLPADFDTDHLGELIEVLIDIALRGPFDRGICQEKLTTVAEHGEYRMGQGFGESMIFREYYVLRQSIWRYIRGRHDDRLRSAFEAIVRIDSAITIATKASIRGYFRPAFEKQGRWPGAIHELVDEWTILPDPKVLT